MERVLSPWSGSLTAPMQSMEADDGSVPGARRISQPESSPASGARPKIRPPATAFWNPWPLVTSPVSSDAVAACGAACCGGAGGGCGVTESGLACSEVVEGWPEG